METAVLFTIVLVLLAFGILVMALVMEYGSKSERPATVRQPRVKRKHSPLSGQHPPE